MYSCRVFLFRVCIICEKLREDVKRICVYVFGVSISSSSSSSSSLFTLVAVQDATKISSHDAPRGFAKRVSGEDFAKWLENFNSVSDGNVQVFL